MFPFLEARDEERRDRCVTTRAVTHSVLRRQESRHRDVVTRCQKIGVILEYYLGCRMIASSQHWHHFSLVEGESIQPVLCQRLDDCPRSDDVWRFTRSLIEIYSSPSYPNKISARHMFQIVKNVSRILLHKFPSWYRSGKISKPWSDRQWITANFMTAKSCTDNSR